VESSTENIKSRQNATLGVVFLTIFVSMVGFGIVIPVLPDYAKNDPFKLTPSALGWLTGIFSLVQLFTAPLLGKISDRIGRKPVLLISIIGTAVGYFVTGAAQATWMLFLGRIIDGASGGNIAAAQAAVADVTPPQERSRAMGIIGAAFGLGFVLGPAIGGVLSLWHHSAPFYFAGVLALVNAFFVVKKLPETLTEEKRLHPTEAAPLHEVFRGGRGPFIGSLLFTIFASTAGFAFIHLLFSLFCADHLGYSRAQMSFAFAYIGVLGALVQGGLLRRLLKRDIEKELVIIGSLILAASLWLLPRVDGTGQFLGVCALMALGNGFVVPTLSGMASRHVHGRAQGRVLGLSSAAGSLGRFLGPMLAALPLPLAFSDWERPLTGDHLAAANHGYLVAFSWAAGFLVITAVVAILMRVPKDPPVE
jgi:DHA1 family tetracycline resistance protein-like MFS transporter